MGVVVERPLQNAETVFQEAVKMAQAQRFFRHLLIVVALFGCGEEDSKSDKETSTDSCLFMGLRCARTTDPLNNEEAPKDDLDGQQAVSGKETKVSRARYDRANHAIIVTLEYGGCSEAEQTFTLGACAESHPAQCTASVTPGPYDPSCDMYIIQEKSFPLPENLDDAYVKFPSGVQALVDKDGDLPPVKRDEIGNLRKIEEAPCGEGFFIALQVNGHLLLPGAPLDDAFKEDGMEVTVTVSDRDLTDAEKNCKIANETIVPVDIHEIKKGRP
jgi:hypothetical protein